MRWLGRSCLPLLGKGPQLYDCVVSLGPVPQIRKPLTVVTMLRMVECLLKLRARKVRAQTAMKKPFAVATFRDIAFAIEHVAFAGLAPRAIRLCLPLAYPAICATHADLLFVHSLHPFTFRRFTHVLIRRILSRHCECLTHFDNAASSELMAWRISVLSSWGCLSVCFMA